MLTYRAFVRYSATVILTFIFSCTKEKEVNVVPYKLSTKVESGTIIYGEKTIVVNDQNSKSLTKITDTALEFSTGSVADNITAGQILMSGITQEAPQGYLRKVTSVQKSGSSIILQTTNATFEEAIKECHLKYTKELSRARIGATAEMFELPYKMEWDKDGNKSTTFDKIEIDATLKIDPDFRFEMDIENFTLKNLVTTTKVTNIGDIEVSFGGKVGSISDVLKNADGFLLGEINLPPFVIPGTPITFINKLKFLIGIEGEISANVTFNPVITGSVEGGIKYTDTKGIEYINEVENKVTMETPIIEGKATFEPWFQLRLQSSPFDMKNVKVFLAARTSLKAEATINQYAINAGLQIGAKLYANAQMQVFGKALIKPIDLTFFDKYYDTPYRWQFVLPLIDIKTQLTDKILGHQAILTKSIKFLSSNLTLQEIGICWSKSNVEPTINTPFGVEKTFSTAFSSPNTPAKYYSSDGNILEDAYMTNLTPNTTYYARSYAKVAEDIIIYGNVVSFTTCNPTIPTGKFNRFTEIGANRITLNMDVLSGCEVEVGYTIYEFRNNLWERMGYTNGTCKNISNPADRPTPFNINVYTYSSGTIDPKTGQLIPIYFKGKKYAVKVSFCNSSGKTETDYIPFEL